MGWFFDFVDEFAEGAREPANEQERKKEEEARKKLPIGFCTQGTYINGKYLITRENETVYADPDFGNVQMPFDNCGNLSYQVFGEMPSFFFLQEIRPVRDIVARYFPNWQCSRQFMAFDCPQVIDIANDVAETFSGRRLSLAVSGYKCERPTAICGAINEAVKARLRNLSSDLKFHIANVSFKSDSKDIDWNAFDDCDFYKMHKTLLKTVLDTDSMMEDFTKKISEKSQVKQLNDGITEMLKGQPILIDGNNVVRHDARHGWRVLKTLLDCLKRDNTDYFLYFDATITHLDMDAEGRDFVQSLLADSTHTTKCPSRDEADKFILNRADKTGSHVISNDGYTQWEEQYPWIGVRNNTGDCRRVHKFSVEGEFLNLPDFGVYEPIGL